MRPFWAHLLPWFLTGLSRASPETRQGIAPSFFAANGKGGNGKEERYVCKGYSAGALCDC